MASVIEDLKRWGPDSSPPIVNLAQAEKYCRELAASHYENFPVISIAVPRPLRQHFANVYAFCRWADDLGDETGSTERSVELLDWWKGELDSCYEGRCTHPVYVALRPTIKKFSIPRQPFEDLICAFEQDQSVRNYEHFPQLLDYCTRSADPVGRIVLYLIGCPTPENLKWSDSICTGLQLANFWQDVSRDFDIGRIYLPLEDRQRFGISESDLSEKRFTPQFRELMKFEVDRTRQILLDGRPLVQALRGRWRVAIDLFQRGGLMILDEIERIDFNVLDQRPIITKRNAAGALFKSVWNSLRGR